MVSRTSIYTASNPRGETLFETEEVADYVSQLRDRPFRANDRRISNKRLMFIYDGLITDVGTAWLTAKMILIVKDTNCTYVAVDFGGTYIGAIDDFIINGLTPRIRTIYQSEWSPIHDYFCKRVARVIESESSIQMSVTSINEQLSLPLSSINVPIAVPFHQSPDNHTSPSQPLWVANIMSLLLTTPNSRIVNWYHDHQGNTGKTRLANHIESSNEGWLVVNDLSDIYHLIAHRNGILRGIILDLDRSYERDPLVYRVITMIKDGRMSHKGRVIRFDPIHLVVLTSWMPDQSTLAVDRWLITEIMGSWSQ